MSDISSKSRSISLWVSSCVLSLSAFFLAAQKIPWLSAANIITGRKYLYLIMFFSTLVVLGLTFFYHKKLFFFVALKKACFFLFPSQIIILIALYYSKDFHIFVFLLTNFFTFSLFALFFRWYLKNFQFDKNFNFNRF